jgi:hypothetical protein
MGRTVGERACVRKGFLTGTDWHGTTFVTRGDFDEAFVM